MVSCTINYNTESQSSKSSEKSTGSNNFPNQTKTPPSTSTGSNNFPNQTKTPPSTSSVNYFEKLKDYLPPEGEADLYQTAKEKTDGGIDVQFYVYIDRALFPHIVSVRILSHRTDTDVCEEQASLVIPEASGQVSSLVHKEATPEQLSDLAELVYKSLNEEGIFIVNPSTLPCKVFPNYIWNIYNDN